MEKKYSHFLNEFIFQSGSAEQKSEKKIKIVETVAMIYCGI